MSVVEWRSAVFAVVLSLATVAGCGIGVDEEQSRLCRQIVAGLEGADGIEVLRVRAVAREARGRQGPGEGVAFSYRVRPESGGVSSPERVVTCLFDPSRPSEPAIDRIVAVETPSGPLSPSRLYMLKRFWLDRR